MTIGEASGQIKLARLIEKEMRDMNRLVQVKIRLERKTRGDVARVIIIGSLMRRSYGNGGFEYRLISAPGSSIDGSIFGPLREHAMKITPNYELIVRIERILAEHNYGFYRRWGSLAEYRTVIQTEQL